MRSGIVFMVMTFPDAETKYSLKEGLCYYYIHYTFRILISKIHFSFEKVLFTIGVSASYWFWTGYLSTVLVVYIIY